MIFEVVVRDRKNKYIYSFSLKAKSLNRAQFFVSRNEESLYEAASDVGIVNLDSNFLEENPKVEITQIKLKKSQKTDVILGNKSYLIKNNKLRAV